MAQLKAMKITASRRLKRKRALISEHFTIEIAICHFVRKHIRNWPHSFGKRQKSPSDEWYNTARSR